jgi:hypothetical protein
MRSESASLETYLLIDSGEERIDVSQWCDYSEVFIDGNENASRKLR